MPTASHEIAADGVDSGTGGRDRDLQRKLIDAARGAGGRVEELSDGLIAEDVGGGPPTETASQSRLPVAAGGTREANVGCDHRQAVEFDETGHYVALSTQFVMRYVLSALLASTIAYGKPDSPAAMPTKRAPDREVGERLWKQSCWQCHGLEGKGDGPAASALVGGVPTLVGKLKKEDFDALVARVQDGKGRMPAYREDIDKHDTRRILDYMRDVMNGKVKAGGEEDSAEEADAGGDDAN